MSRLFVSIPTGLNKAEHDDVTGTGAPPRVRLSKQLVVIYDNLCHIKYTPSTTLFASLNQIVDLFTGQARDKFEVLPLPFFFFSTFLFSRGEG